MDNAKILNHSIATIGWGALFVWWGISILIDPITIGMSAVGTGLILLGVNAARSLKGIPIKNSNTPFIIVAIAWGILDTVFNPRFMLSFALMLIIIGVVVIISLLTNRETT